MNFKILTVALILVLPSPQTFCQEDSGLGSLLATTPVVQKRAVPVQKPAKATVKVAPPVISGLKSALEQAPKNPNSLKSAETSRAAQNTTTSHFDESRNGEKKLRNREAAALTTERKVVVSGNGALKSSPMNLEEEYHRKLIGVLQSSADPRKFN